MSEPNITGNTDSTPIARRAPRHLFRATMIWAVLSLIGIVIAITTAPFVFPVAASGDAAFDNTTIMVFTALAIPVAMFVFVGLGYSLIVFRVKERPTEAGVPLKAGTALQAGWLGVTSLLCLVVLIWGLVGFYQQPAAASSTTPLVVQVTGQQWVWTFNYPQYGVASQGQLIELPVNRPVIFTVTSKDVLHGFSIRALGVRLDANPGEVIDTQVVTPNEIGDYTVNCVEMCGLYHSFMYAIVKVVDSATFNSYISDLGGHI